MAQKNTHVLKEMPRPVLKSPTTQSTPTTVDEKLFLQLSEDDQKKKT